MAREGKDKALIDVYVGIDPGDRWMGVAVLEVNLSTFPTKCTLDMGVLDTNIIGFVRSIQQVTPSAQSVLNKRVHVITEEYRARAQGHQVFSRGDTQRLIGGIRYACESQMVHWTEVGAGDPDDQLPKLGLQQYWNFLKECSRTLPRPGDAKWHHGRSALRVLGSYLLTANQPLLQMLRRAPAKTPTFNEIGGTSADRWIAPTMRWFT